MRRLAAAGVILLFGLSACAKPVAGADGNLTNGWPAVAEVKQFVPVVGTCYAQERLDTMFMSTSSLDCAQTHSLQSYYIGEFTGADADRGTVPKPLTKEISSAFKVCDKEATKFIGRQWRDLRVRVAVSVPPQAAWQAGVRWFQCNLLAQSDIGDNPMVWTGSLADAKAKELLLSCYNYDEASDKSTKSSCSKAHNAEYAGSFIAPSDFKYPKTEAQWDRVHDKCFEILTKFVGVPIHSLRAGVLSWPVSQKEWNAGDRGFRCFLWMGKHTMTKSAKGSKGSGISFRE